MVTTSDQAAVIVVEVAPQQWKCAKLVAVDQLGGEPALAIYQVAPGLPYDREHAALADARLVLARNDGKPW